MPESASSHLNRAAEHVRHDPVRCAVLTISDTRTMETDESGALMERLISAAGHLPIVRALVSDDPEAIELQLRRWLADSSIQVILTTGGTGISPRDGTISVVRRLLTVELEGFGELFRMLSYQDVQAAAMLSRAIGGLVVNAPAAPDGMADSNAAEGDGTGRSTFIFAMPGSTNAVKVAMKQLIVPQLAHLVWERARQ